MKLISLNVGRPTLLAVEGRTLSTAINRRPAQGPVTLTRDGLAGDRVADARYHGGEHKALCCYPHEHYAHWSERLGVTLDVPAFGENLTTLGLVENEVCIGDRFAVGDAVIEVSGPRLPCRKLAMKHRRPDLPSWIRDAGFTGFYLRVITEAAIEAGADITLLDRPHPGFILLRVTRNRFDPAPDRAFIDRLAAIPQLDPAWWSNLIQG